MRERGQHWLLLNIHRPRPTSFTPLYALTLSSPSENYARTIKQHFPSLTHLVFQLWPCSLGQSHRINIQLGEMEEGSKEMRGVVRASATITYGFRGESYKFFGGRRKEELVLEFKVVERSLQEITSETDQLRKLNVEMENYLTTCQAELKEYQNFLTSTNQVLLELNRPTPIRPSTPAQVNPPQQRQVRQFIQDSFELEKVEAKGQGEEKIDTTEETGYAVSNKSKITTISRRSYLEASVKQSERGQPPSALNSSKETEVHGTPKDKSIGLSTPNKYPYLSNNKVVEPIQEEPVSEESSKLAEQQEPNRASKRRAQTESQGLNQPQPTEEQLSQDRQSLNEARQSLNAAIKERRNHYQIEHHPPHSRQRTDPTSRLSINPTITLQEYSQVKHKNLTQHQTIQITQTPTSAPQQPLHIRKDSLHSNSSLLNSHHFHHSSHKQKSKVSAPQPQFEILPPISPLATVEKRERRVRQHQKISKKKEDECSVVGSESDLNISSPMIRGERQVDKDDRLWDLEMLWLKAKTFTFNGVPKRCLLSVWGTHYQTSYGVSINNLTEWIEPILIRKIKSDSTIACSLCCRPQQPQTLATGEISLLKLINSGSNTFKSYLYQDELAVGFIEGKFVLTAVSKDTRTSTDDTKNTREGKGNNQLKTYLFPHLK